MARRPNLLLLTFAVIGVPVSGSTVLLPGTSRPCLSPPNLADPCRHLIQSAHAAHAANRYDEEIGYRVEISKMAWAAYRLGQKDYSSGQYRYWIVFDNDLKLGLLLAGSARWDEAETVFRHNRDELSDERLAGNDIKSENELLLAHLLMKEGKQHEADQLCQQWKGRVEHNADGLLWAARHDVPRPPVYDTREVENAKWKVACGQAAAGLALLSQQIALYPQMLAPFEVLADYYYVEGDLSQALKAEINGSLAVSGPRK